jgi:aspartyl-tRNA(Asn)/glutamyl-tRNA(Gln) amidotransferase subunit C
MAQLTIDEVKRLAALSRLQLSDEEAAEFLKELNAILGYVEKLSSVDTTGIEPTAQVTGLKNVMRPDEPIDYGSSREELLKNAPAQQDGYIKVKKVL